MIFSIIIPTYNRADKLTTCIDKIYESILDEKEFEILVIDDGSTDNTEEIINEYKKENLKYFKQQNKGAGQARNKGIKEAKGRISIFIGDDIFITKEFLNEHLNIHKKNPEPNFACLGLTLWDPTIKINKLMKWSTNELLFLGKFGGHQFAYNTLTPNKEASYKHFYTSNISIKTELLKNNPFSKEFSTYGWEDIELAYRLKKNNELKIIYNPKALAYHSHEIPENSFENRMKSIGKGAVIFNKLHPETNIMPRGIKKILLKIIASKPIIKIAKTLKIEPVYYYALSKRYFFIGLKEQIS
jgi:glycosyltransferase involved in cell wall biosynthesis